MDRRSFLAGVAVTAGAGAWWVGAVPRVPSGQEVTASAEAAAPPLEAFETAVHKSVNGLREDAGVGRLTHNDGLAAVARAHSRDMAAREFFAHRNPDGETVRDRLRTAGEPCGAPGENLAQRDPASDSPAEFGLAVAGQWERSEGHRENLLRAGYRREGIGVERRGGVAWITQVLC